MGLDLREAKAESNMAFLSLLLSVWEVCSSGMEVPYFLVTGAKLDGEAGWAPVVKVLAEGFGEEVSRGWDPDAGRGWSRLGKRGDLLGPRAWAVMLALWACRAMSCRARCCRTGPAASVRVCLSRAETISLAQVAWRRAACFFSLAAIRVLPAFFSAVGAASGRYGLQGRVMGQAGSQDGLEGGAGLGGCTGPGCGPRPD